MAKIQLISNNFIEDPNNIKLSSFDTYNAFNSYNINIIDLTNKEFWDYDIFKNYYVNFSDLEPFIESILNTNNDTEFIFILPQNSSVTTKNNEIRQLSNDLEPVNFLLDYFFDSFIKIKYTKSITKITEKNFNADFYFKEDDGYDVIRRNENNDAIIIKKNNFIFTTLELKDSDSLEIFLREIHSSKREYEIPDWFSEIKILDDQEHMDLITEYKNEIKTLEVKIEESQEILNENNKFKSILYTNSKALANVVFEILEEILDCDLTDFVDVYDEDFYIEIDEHNFIGEIKGVNRNAKNQHLSQLNDHAEKKLDNFKENEMNKELKQILIINTFREMPPDERPEIEDETINKAENMYKSLIIKTEDLLKLFAQFRENKIKSEDIIELFENEIGLFDVNDLN